MLWANRQHTQNRIVLRAYCMIAMGLTPVGAQVCSNMNTSAHSALEYLRGERASQEAACVRQALERLRSPRFASQARLVVRYLDYRFPVESSKTAVVGRLPRVRAEYPAVATLFEMGIGAAPAVLEALRDSQTSLIARDNALLVFMMVHEDHPEVAVRKLREAELAEQDPVAARLLFDGAREAVKKCWGEHTSACYEALR